MFSFGPFIHPTAHMWFLSQPKRYPPCQQCSSTWKTSPGQGFNLYSPSPGSTLKHEHPKWHWRHQRRMEEGVGSSPPGAGPAPTRSSANHSIPFSCWPSGLLLPVTTPPLLHTCTYTKIPTRSLPLTLSNQKGNVIRMKLGCSVP